MEWQLGTSNIGMSYCALAAPSRPARAEGYRMQYRVRRDARVGPKSPRSGTWVNRTSHRRRPSLEGAEGAEGWRSGSNG